MKYLGGKHRYGVEIAQVVRSKLRFDQVIIEPFCGALWVTQHFQSLWVFASDICNPLILLYNAIREGWEPPDYVSEEEYNDLRALAKEGVETSLIGFVGFACSWSGKWFGGYARAGINSQSMQSDNIRNYCLEAKKSLLAKMKRCKDVKFTTKNYRNLSPKNAVIYCDPPYAGTTEYGYNYGWCSTTFWKTMDIWNLDNTVLVSEYKAPDGWKPIWKAEHFSIASTSAKPTTEYLFIKE